VLSHTSEGGSEVTIGRGKSQAQKKKLLWCSFVNYESHIKSSSTECKGVQWEASNYLTCSMTVEIVMHIWHAWCCTSSMQQASTHKFHYQLVAQCLCLLYNAATCLGHSFLPSSRRYKMIDMHNVYGNLSEKIGRLYSYYIMLLCVCVVCVCVCVWVCI